MGADLDHAVGTLSLNRVEAACQLENIASMELLKKSGFSQEGKARDYLEINGKRHDCAIFAITNSDFRLRNE